MERQPHAEMSVSDGEVHIRSPRVTPVLLHMETPMRWDPANVHPDALMYELRTRRSVHVQLEPGDATRYDLIIMWAPAIATAFNLGRDAGDALLVTRVRSGEVVGAVLYGWMNFGAVAKIAGGNEWSAEFLSWWLDELLSRLTA